MGISIAKLVKEAKKVDTIVTRPITDWLLTHGDDAFSPEVVTYIADQLQTQPRVRTGSFSGAAAGMCLRRQELAFAGVPGEPIDPQLRNIFNDGKWRHLRWQAMLLETGIITDPEYLVQWPKFLSRGSLDARGEVPMDHHKPTWRGKEFGFELKGVSTFQYGELKKNGPMDKHMRQIHHYFVLGNFDLFSIVYEDKTTQDWIEWVVEPDRKLLIEAENDMRELAKAVKSRKLHGMQPACIKRKGIEFNDCPFGGARGECVKALTKLPKGFSWPKAA
ncbi:hypothetical protein BH789_gp093 [Gordonia phage GMA6]|uniref:Uncharacterized protein n=1 Tax=Gordonia phage GMA6 TaxID=1647285 RepID=A0A0K0NL94_9CAUD|nr:hypothetical protein BH789_gp093 [Gordonia phage GMA6]AKL88374.1 hypothetical protein GMA6_93 [Gordonia phage GMA6]